MKKPNRYQRQSRWRARNPWARHVEWARRRCTDKKKKDYQFYGAKGIKVRLTGKEAAKLWERDGAAAMVKPSLDRKNSIIDYTFDNCRFIEHALNSRLPHDFELREKYADELPAWVQEGN